MSTTQPDGYLALPSTGSGKGVLVLHAWWGLNNTIKAFCDRLADAGFVAFAPDLYHGKVADQIAEAEALTSALNGTADQAASDLTEAVAFLKERAGSGDAGLTVIGFSLGAYFALELSTSAPDDIRSVVVFYGTGPTDFADSKARYLGHFAEMDAFEPAAQVSELEGLLKAAGRPVTFYTYPGTGHWFFESDRADAYNQAATQLAWERTLAFLRQG